jgi:hypothetical protein
MFRRYAPLQDLNLYVLCLCDGGPDTSLHPISQEELRAAFNPQRWNGMSPPSNRDRIHTSHHDDGARLVRDNQPR